MAFLVIEERGQKRHHPIAAARVSIGRAPDNDVVISDEKSSRHHLVIEQQGRSFLVRDLKSKNGSFIDGLRIQEQPLDFGDCVTIGNAKIFLETEESTAFETAAHTPLEPVSENAEDSVSGTMLTVHAADWREILGAFEGPARKPGVQEFLDAACQFAAKVIGNVRTGLFARDGGEFKVLAFRNFLSSRPLDEVPRDFQAKAARCLDSKAPILEKSDTAPARAYLPVSLHDESALLLYIEAESKSRDFSDADQQAVRAIVHPVAALAGLKTALGERILLKQEVARLERELDKLKEDLQRRIDLQTADLSKREASLGGQQLKHDYSSIIGRSAKMRDVFSMIDKVTDQAVPVLIIGESGTGKDLIAKALHENSRRAIAGQFVAENCAALPETLLESELFGYVKGAFTGADRDKVGLFETADNGTIFLDEIGETTPAFQAKLLRVLEDGIFRPVGSNKVKHANFRLVCATNRSLEEMVKAGKFRQDLYYRINVITIKLPPLRDRREDIPLLVEHFLNQAAVEAGEEPKRPSSGVMRAMMEYAWPGNVRELENEIKRMVALAHGDKVGVDGMSPALRGAASAVEMDADDDLPLKELVELVEKRRIDEVLKRTEGNKSKAAEILGLSRLGLRKKMERYGMSGADDL
ncbi:MAG: sigma 54-interacting transcriptional regulator [Planctomycetaceae bacterium]|nr:sigma 54-interacting transcriptional regulator [Planctomycetaceae bacterium]